MVTPEATDTNTWRFGVQSGFDLVDHAFHLVGFDGDDDNIRILDGGDVVVADVDAQVVGRAPFDAPATGGGDFSGFYFFGTDQAFHDRRAQVSVSDHGDADVFHGFEIR